MDGTQHPQRGETFLSSRRSMVLSHATKGRPAGGHGAFLKKDGRRLPLQDRERLLQALDLLLPALLALLVGLRLRDTLLLNLLPILQHRLVLVVEPAEVGLRLLHLLLETLELLGLVLH